MSLERLPFREATLVDTEYSSRAGERPRPICLVARELRSGREIRMWEDELRARRSPPYAIGPDSVVFAYYGSAEVACHHALGWEAPRNLIDLYAEFRIATNGKATPCGSGLLGALAYYGLPHIDGVEKEEMRALAIRGGPWTPEERAALIAYCASDVRALAHLLEKMLPDLDVERALLRGWYMSAAAKIEHDGVPIDAPALAKIRKHWSGIKGSLVESIDASYGVFEGTTFKADRWSALVTLWGLPWPRTERGALRLDDDTFREMARLDPRVAPVRELRHALSELRLEDLAVGADGRNRVMLSAFRAKTGRNAPSNTRFVFGPATWIRNLIVPPAGGAVVYADWSQQEFGIAAALSGDAAMMDAYTSGDPYLEFARQARAVPLHATKASHSEIREQFKACALAVQYGMGAASLAARLGRSVAEAEVLLRLHRRTYPRFWSWSDGAVNHALLAGCLWTVFGWTIHTGSAQNVRSLQNFLMQANGAEMLRLACCLGVERGLTICAPVHDAILIEAPLAGVEEQVELAERVMGEASELVLGGFRLRTESKIVRYPDHYSDKRGEVMWRTVTRLVEEAEAEEQRLTRAPLQQDPCKSAHPSDLLSPGSCP